MRACLCYPPLVHSSVFRLFRSAVWLVEILIKGKIFKDAAAVAAAVPTAPPAGRMNTKKA